MSDIWQTVVDANRPAIETILRRAVDMGLAAAARDQAEQAKARLHPDAVFYRCDKNHPHRTHAEWLACYEHRECVAITPQEARLSARVARLEAERDNAMYHLTYVSASSDLVTAAAETSEHVADLARRLHEVGQERDRMREALAAYAKWFRDEGMDHPRLAEFDSPPAMPGLCACGHAHSLHVIRWSECMECDCKAYTANGAA